MPSGGKRKQRKVNIQSHEEENIQAIFHANDVFFEDEDDVDKGALQACVNVVDMSDMLLRLNGRRHGDWTEEEKNEVAAFMRNRLGICQSDHAAIRAAGLEEAWMHWDEQFTDLCFSDPTFMKLLDPFVIVVEVIPVNDAAYIAALNATNEYLGGGSVAGATGQPLVFMRGLNWMLAVPTLNTGKRALAHLHGQLDSLGLFRASLISYVYILVD
jgi:hypothetical protein